MRPIRFRVVRPLVLSIVILSCATENAVGPPISQVNRGAAITGTVTPAKVVISQVYGGGGNANAQFNRDFVELFNAGGTEQNLSGWSIQYASAQGTGNFGVTNQIAPLSGTIQPGEYVLVSGSSGATGVPFTADIDPVAPITPINLSGTNGKIALVASANSLGCNGGSAPCSAAALALIVDLVGYGTTASAGANFYETTGSTPPTTAAPTLANTTAAMRKDHGCTDTNNNGGDFTSAPPAPRNRATTHNPCVPIVPAGPVATVTISPEDGSVRKGRTLQLSAVGKDVDDNVAPTTFTWLSSNTAVVTISSSGVATGVTEGTVDVTVTSANNVSATTTLSVAEGVGAGSISISI
ncbi:MAG TPA: lamin tail domain-containing protein, partial [Gemmatimonadaceae bacterium]|nr:lamin tail domain-containing protein [Gemmatimonadaceae bacterium]